MIALVVLATIGVFFLIAIAARVGRMTVLLEHLATSDRLRTRREIDRANREAEFFGGVDAGEQSA